MDVKPKRNSRRRKLRSILISAMLCVCLTVTLFPGAAIPADAATAAQNKSTLQSYQAKLADNAAQMKKLEAQIAAMKQSKQDALTQKDNLDQQISLLVDNINDTQGEIDTLGDIIAQNQSDMDGMQAELDADYAKFCNLMRQSEEDEESNYLVIIFGATSISDLVSRVELVGEMLSSNQQLMDKITRQKSAMADTLQQNQADQADLQSAMSSLQNQQSALESKRNEAIQTISQINTDISEANAAYAQETKDSANLSSQIKSLNAQLQAQQSSLQIAYSGKFQFPLPAQYEKISSPFGPRRNPFTGAAEIHNGIDLPAPRDTPIYAAAGGTVIIAQVYYTYGNCVVINHGGGITTLYAHMDNGSMKVKVGDTVKQGQQIGAVGMTGAATGYHLHFSIAVNGNFENPVTNAFSSIKFKYY